MVKNYNEVLYDNEQLDSNRIVLRKFKKEDTPGVFEYGSDAETVKDLIWAGLTTIDEARAAITDYYWSKPGIFAIVLKENNKCIGCIDIRLIPEHEKATFGYVLNRSYWGRGYMTEALSAVLLLCFGKLELNRVEGEHFIGNEASGRVMEKCGMTLEGIGKREVKIKGAFRDVAHYAINTESFKIRLAEVCGTGALK